MPGNQLPATVANVITTLVGREKLATSNESIDHRNILLIIILYAIATAEVLKEGKDTISSLETLQVVTYPLQ